MAFISLLQNGRQRITVGRVVNVSSIRGILSVAETGNARILLYNTFTPVSHLRTVRQSQQLLVDGCIALRSNAMKRCSKCRKLLLLDNFSPHKRMKDGKQGYCKKCARDWHHAHPEYVKRKNAEYKAANPSYHKDWQRKNRYGISREQVEQARIFQGGKCIGCLTELASVKECVDHNHKTGKFRGLLCDDCNIAIGRLKDNPEILRRLEIYLRNSG